jgi:hypothetical protein
MRLVAGLSDEARAVVALVLAALASRAHDPAALCDWLESYLDQVLAASRAGPLAAAA